MFTIDLPIPKAGAFPGFIPTDIPKPGARRLENLRLDEGLLGLRAGSTLFHPAPDSKQVLDGFTVTLRDGTVRALRFVKDNLHYDAGNTWVAVTLGAALTGLETNRFWAVAAPWAATAGRVIFSNGIQIQSWDGVPANATVAVAGGYPARFGAIGNDNRLFVGYVSDGGLKPRRIRWTVVALTNGGATDWTNPGSGALDIENESSPITSLWQQRGRIYIGKERSIVTLDPTGLPRNAYGYSPVKPASPQGGTGPIQFSVVQSDDNAFFISRQDVHVFDGGNATSVGGAVRLELLRRLNFSALQRVSSILDSANQRVGWLLPLDGSATGNAVWWLDLTTGRWETDTRAATCVFLHSFSAPVYIADLTALYPPGKIADLPGVGGIPDLSPPTDERGRVAFGLTGGKVLVSDSTVATDDGSTILSTWESSAIRPVGETVSRNGQPYQITEDDMLVLDRVRLLLVDRGADYSLDVDASTDGGSTWTSAGTVSLVSTQSETARRFVETFTSCRIAVEGPLQLRVKTRTSGVKWGVGPGWLRFDIIGKRQR